MSRLHTWQRVGLYLAGYGGLECHLELAQSQRNGNDDIDHCFEGLDNTQVIADDTIIYGSGENDAEADKSHETQHSEHLSKDAGKRV